MSRPMRPRSDRRGIRESLPASAYTVARDRRLRQGVRLPSHQLDFRRSGRGWELVIDRPPLTRMEYLLELRHGDGSAELATDPGNPLRVLRPATHPAAR